MKLMNNYLRLGYSEDGKIAHYIFYDTESFYADEMLTRREVHFKSAQILTRPGEDLALYSLPVRKSEENRFRAAMEDLKTALMFMGYRDYECHCGKLIAELKTMIKASAEATGWIELPEGGMIKAGELE